MNDNLNFTRTVFTMSQKHYQEKILKESKADFQSLPANPENY
jgi:hypothetical protein